MLKVLLAVFVFVGVSYAQLSRTQQFSQLQQLQQLQQLPQVQQLPQLQQLSQVQSVPSLQQVLIPTGVSTQNILRNVQSSHLRNLPTSLIQVPANTLLSDGSRTYLAAQIQQNQASSSDDEVLQFLADVSSRGRQNALNSNLLRLFENQQRNNNENRRSSQTVEDLLRSRNNNNNDENDNGSNLNQLNNVPLLSLVHNNRDDGNNNRGQNRNDERINSRNQNNGRINLNRLRDLVQN